MENKKLSDVLQEKGITIGDRLEVILKQGVVHDNGWTPAPTVNPQGFYADEDMKDEPGMKLIGYMNQYCSHKDQENLTLSTVWNNDKPLKANDGGSFRYVDREAIYSLKKL
jgi:hypothetical protein